MNRIKIWAYKPGSKSATALARSLDTKVIRHQGSLWRGGPDKTVINWGSTDVGPQVKRSKVLNKPEAVAVAHNKLTTFQKLTEDDEIHLPAWTVDKDKAKKWLEDGKCVLARQSLTGHSGQGIVVMEKPLDFVDAPVYTIYIGKEKEYRIHVLNGEIIFRQQKVRDRDGEPKTWKIRSHANGFVFQHNDINVPEEVDLQALMAVKALGLDFGGVDVIISKRTEKAIVLEVNTACGLEGETVTAYANAFKRQIGV